MSLTNVEIRQERTINSEDDLVQVLGKISFKNSVLDFHWRYKHRPYYDMVAHTGDARQVGWLLWAEFLRPDIHTGIEDWGRGREEVIRMHRPEAGVYSYEGGVVKTAYVLYRFIIEHEAMEGFQYEGIRVFNPHHTIPELQLPAQIAAARKENEADQTAVRNSVDGVVDMIQAQTDAEKDWQYRSKKVIPIIPPKDMKYHHVEVFRFDKWTKLPFAEGSRVYCTGYIDALNSMYPSPSHRIVENETGKIVMETKGNGKVHVN